MIKTTPNKEECPHILRRWVIDEFIYFCKIEDKVCQVWAAVLECERWENIKKGERGQP